MLSFWVGVFSCVKQSKAGFFIMFVYSPLAEEKPSSPRL